MGKQAIEDLLPRADWSVYRLVRMASKRALEISEGSPCLIKNPTTDKATTTALEEIAQGKVECVVAAASTISQEPEESDESNEDQ